MNRLCNKFKQEGFSLIELMVGVAVLGIVLSTGVPSMIDFSHKGRQTTTINDFVSSLHYARSEAVKRQSNIGVCPSVSGVSCALSPWSEGWIIFVNTDNDSPAAIDAGEEILRVHAALHTGSRLIAEASLLNGLTYQPRGFPSAFGDFLYCDSRGEEHAKTLKLRLGGKLNLSDYVASSSTLSCL